MHETIESTSIDLSPSNLMVRIGATYHRKLKIMADEQHRSMTGQFENMVEAEWDRTHPQPITISEELERG
jgi:predicted HicB family RNase H-like nuclease